MKNQSLPSLIREADRITSEYIRRKWADENGYVKCCTCDTVKHWKEMHCCHYIERGCKATRWMEENLRPGCRGCNVFHSERHKRRFSFVLEDWYGREFVTELEKLERKVLKPSEVRDLAEEAILYYSQMLKEL